MDILIQPKKLNGTVPAIQSKSHAHRAMICAALAGKPDLVRLEGPSDDLLATQQAVEIFRGAGTAACRESGTTLRLLVPPAAARGLAATFTGEGRLPRRPMEPLLSLMEDHGVRFSSRTLPFRLSGKLKSGRYALPGNVSSQYISGLLLALPLLEGDSELVLTTELESAGYVDMTIDCQKQFGIRLVPMNNPEPPVGSRNPAVQQHPSEAGSAGCGWRIPGGQAYRAPAALDVEGDWSSAAFWLVASALGSSVDVTGLSSSSLQRDRQLVSIVEQNETDIDVRDIPDLVPILAVLAAGRRGPKDVKTVLRNGSRLRLKESDRIESVLAMIRALGGTIENPGDDLIVTGTGTLAGGTVHSAGDHRIAMAAAIAATVCTGPVTILDAHVASKSYPDFFAHYESLGGETHVL